MDSLGHELGHWLAQIGIDDATTASAEAARQRIGRLSRLFTAVLDEVALGHDISPGDWEALSAIRRADGPCTPTTLARTLDLTSGTISVRLQRLIAAGLVAPVDAADGRSRPVRLTASGRSRWTAATVDRVSVESALFGVLDDDALAELNSLLAQVLESFEKRYGAAPRHDRIG